MIWARRTCGRSFDGDQKRGEGKAGHIRFNSQVDASEKKEYDLYSKTMVGDTGIGKKPNHERKTGKNGHFRLFRIHNGVPAVKRRD